MLPLALAECCSLRCQAAAASRVRALARDLGVARRAKAEVDKKLAAAEKERTLQTNSPVRMTQLEHAR